MPLRFSSIRSTPAVLQAEFYSTEEGPVRSRGPYGLTTRLFRLCAPLDENNRKSGQRVHHASQNAVRVRARDEKRTTPTADGVCDTWDASRVSAIEQAEDAQRRAQAPCELTFALT